MKAEKYFLINEQARKQLATKIYSINLGEGFKVTISKSGSKSDRQRGLDYQWDTDIFNSGLGWGDKTIIDVHARNKWLFARPILLRDDDIFPLIYKQFMGNYGKDAEKCQIFARDYISTEKFSTNQASEYMNNKQTYWIEKGVNLTDPSLYGLDFRN